MHPRARAGVAALFFLNNPPRQPLTHSRREELDGEGHPLKNRFCHVWANCSSGRRKQGWRPGSSVTPSNSALLSFYGDAARLVAERDGKSGDVVSQSCLRRPWRTGELRRPGLDKRGADRLLRPPTDKHTPPCPGLEKKRIE